MSGGSIWVPNNHLMKKARLSDSPEEALTHPKAVTAGRVPEEHPRAYVQVAPEMVKCPEEKSHVRFQIVPGDSHYYPGLPGGKPGGGRAIEVSPVDARKLARARAELRLLPRQTMVFGRMMATAYDAHRPLDSSVLGRMRAARIFALYLLNPFRSLAKTDTRLTLGDALADRRAPVWMWCGGRQARFHSGRPKRVAGHISGAYRGGCLNGVRDDIRRGIQAREANQAGRQAETLPCPPVTVQGEK